MLLILGTSFDIEQIKTWDKEGAPVYVEHLLLLWDRKNINAPGWDGWLFSRGTLLYRKQRFTATGLLEQRNYLNRIVELEGELYHLKSWKGIIEHVFKKRALFSESR